MQDLYVFEIRDEIKHTNKVKLENLLKKGKEQLKSSCHYVYYSMSSINKTKLQNALK